MDKEVAFVVGVVVLFFTLLFGGIMYQGHLKSQVLMDPNVSEHVKLVIAGQF